MRLNIDTLIPSKINKTILEPPPLFKYPSYASNVG